MEATVKDHINQILMKHNFRKEGAHFISGTLEELDTKQETAFVNYKELFLTQKDKTEIIRTVYITGLVQFIAIVASLVGIVNFMLK